MTGPGRIFKYLAMNNTILDRLIDKGVVIPNPETVFISQEVDPDRICGNGVTLYGGTKLVGSRTLIMDNAVIGYQAPVTLENTLVGPGTKLNGGFFQDAVFLGKNDFGSGAHVRAGTILEEEANAAHTVGLKQTILFPFVTLGSLINFCDCFMSGGTSRKDHSEVGSSFIHFNYTPNQDKATPSMFGNICDGVMLNQLPVFLGGQGGVVGPARVAFGCISAAGSIVRKTEDRANRIILGGGLKNLSMPRKPGVYARVEEIYTHNLIYIGELFALRAWYHHVRPLFAKDALSRALIFGLQENLEACIKERIKRLLALEEKLDISKQVMATASDSRKNPAIAVHDKVINRLKTAGPIFDALLSAAPQDHKAAPFVRAVAAGIQEQGLDYVRVIQGLSQNNAALGTQWLTGIAKEVVTALAL